MCSLKPIELRVNKSLGRGEAIDSLHQQEDALQASVLTE